jgi:hypothetical protein
MAPADFRPGASPRLRVAGLAASVALLAVLTGCAQQPGPSANPSPVEASRSASARPSPSATESASPTPTPTPEPSVTPPTPAPGATGQPGATIQLPAACEDIHSEALLAMMTDMGMGLNDPGVTLLSTEMTQGLEILESAPTIRCSWGAPSEFGLATNVTIVDAAQATALEQAMRDTGMTCTEYEQGTLCRIETEHLQDDDVVTTTGETHYLRGNAWVSTHWIEFNPEGYTEDIVETLWG